MTQESTDQTTVPPSESAIRQVDSLLAERYGNRKAEPGGDPVGGLIRTILSQNTNDTNSRAAYASLRNRFSTWDDVADASHQQIARAIKRGGLADQKAARIKAILQEIRREHGRITLDFLHELSPDDANDYLTAFKGVGPKTAACVLLFQLGKPVFPVDTHVHRICTRLRWIPDNASAAKAHDILGSAIPPELRYRLHVSMIDHGRTLCRPRSPICGKCPIIEHCHYPAAQ